MESPYISKEVSWLAFNERVLQEAASPLVPLLERLKFFGIHSSNQEESFPVRVATRKGLSQFGSGALQLIHQAPGTIRPRRSLASLAAPSRLFHRFQGKEPPVPMQLFPFTLN